ncbi:6-phosphogluconolactonase [Fretibacter rubidus]|uniref:6-phosphogluconolactonase n=1 Tax=Fretibacter rubidus TaxID=570162 RepID=UPI00352A2AC2
MSGHFQIVSSRAAIAPIAADMIASAILRDVHSRGTASIMLSGGSTPGATFEALSHYDLPWDKVTIGLVDDRWVPETNKGSNGALIRRTLLRNKAKSATFIPMKTHHDTIQGGLANVAKAYAALSRPYSFVLLGMGPDGHTASWFPKADGLDYALDMNSGAIVAPITANKSPVTGDYLHRMTLTLPAIADARFALLLLTGAEKRVVFEAAQDASLNYPITHAITALGERLTTLYAE